MTERTIAHEFRGEQLHSVFVGTGGAARGTVIIVPTVAGISDLERRFAGDLEDRGYACLIADLWGRRFSMPDDRPAAFEQMGRLKADRAALRDRLLDMLTAARQSDSMEDLDHMQAEADAILRDTLQCFEHGAIEEGTLTAFNIAIEQFHNAVADRKALLMSVPQNLQRASAQFRAASTA